MKNWQTTLLLALGCTLVSVLISLGYTVYRKVKLLSGFKLKDLLREIYPEHEWEHTGLNIHLTGITFSAWYPEGFDYQEGETEEMVLAAMYEKVPGLKCHKPKMVFQPLAEFDPQTVGDY